jgi:hypothetical protein
VLREWLRKSEVEAGEVVGVTTESARQIRALKRKNAELERTIEILKMPRLPSVRWSLIVSLKWWISIRTRERDSSLVGPGESCVMASIWGPTFTSRA